MLKTTQLASWCKFSREAARDFEYKCSPFLLPVNANEEHQSLSIFFPRTHTVLLASGTLTFDVRGVICYLGIVNRVFHVGRGTGEGFQFLLCAGGRNARRRTRTRVWFGLGCARTDVLDLGVYPIE